MRTRWRARVPSPQMRHWADEGNSSSLGREVESLVGSGSVEALEGATDFVHNANDLYPWVLENVLRNRNIFVESPTLDLSFFQHLVGTGWNQE